MARRARVTCRFRGGLANQMFTAATTLAYGWRHDLQVVMSPRQATSAANPAVAGRSSVLNAFPLLPRSRKRVAIDAVTFRDRWELHEFQPLAPPRDGRDVILDGLFGHSDYFADHRGRLAECFALPTKQWARVWQDYGALFEHETVSVSVRRGDYLKQRALRRYDLELDFYRRALELVPQAAAVLVFSDDLAWCRENVGFDRPTRFVGSGSPAVDLHLIRRCDHHVIPNSTYAWWAAWLDVDSGVTVQPDQWFTDEFVERLGRSPSAHDPGGWINV